MQIGNRLALPTKNGNAIAFNTKNFVIGMIENAEDDAREWSPDILPL